MIENAQMDPVMQNLHIAGADRTVRTEPLVAGGPLPVLVRPAEAGTGLVSWAAAHRDFVDSTLTEHGAILFRGFGVGGLPEFREFIQTVGGELEQYTYRSTPRTEVTSGIYTSTEYPADQSIPFHNENSYTRSWPLKLFFYCELPSAEGGMTPIADSHRVYERISEATRERFRAKGVMYVRNYGPWIDLPWQEVFQTDDRAQVEAFCRSHEIEMEWQENDHLRTRQVCQAVARHPETKKMLWFNQAHLFHVSNLGAEVSEALVDALGEDGVPRNTFYGDGTPIEDSVLEEIRGAYAAEELAFPWERDDVLLVDNMAFAHSRTPYKGERKIRVGMTEPIDGSTLQV